MNVASVKTGRRGRPRNARIIGWLSFSAFDYLSGNPIHRFEPESSDLFVGDSIYVFLGKPHGFLFDPHNSYRVELSTNGRLELTRVIRRSDGFGDIIPLYFGSVRLA